MMPETAIAYTFLLLSADHIMIAQIKTVDTEYEISIIAQRWIL